MHSLRKGLIILALFMVAMTAASGSFARAGMGRCMGRGMGGGGCLLTSGAAVINLDNSYDIQGIVAGVIRPGGGISIDTGSGMVNVFGVGPYWYWANLGVPRPSIGDQVFVEVAEINFSDGSSRVVALNITVGGTTVQLRDASGIPLWI